MYRQRKRDLNLKPNRQLDKRSSRGMIYENEELRMRTIAICEDVDRGQSDIKKLRKENDYLKREIWGLRDECEKLEEMLKKVCISANIPEIQLESSSKHDDDDYKDDDEDDEDEDDDESFADDNDPPDKYLKAGSSSSSKQRERKASGTSVGTFDSEVGSYISNMFGDGNFQQEEIAFATEDPGSVILNPALSTVQNSEPVAGTSAASANNFQHLSWSAAHAPGPPDLEAVREESESNLNSPVEPPTPLSTSISFDEELLVTLPDPNTISLPPVDNNFLPTDDRKTPVIQITPASSPTSNSNETTTSLDMEAVAGPEQDSIQNAGCVTVVPKTFKVTSELLVGNGSNEGEVSQETPPIPPLPPLNFQSRSAELPRKFLHYSHPPSSFSDKNLVAGGTCQQRRSYYYPVGTMPLPHLSAAVGHKNYGILGYCCCNNANDLLLGGCQSEPTLTSSPTAATSADGLEPVSIDHPISNTHSSATSFFSTLCCRGGPPPAFVTAPPVTLKSMWNTVDKNIVIGFYGYSTGGGESGNVDHFSAEPKVQDIIDKLEAGFDPTLENILGIRLISPGRIFISLKNASVVKSFLAHFKNDLILVNKQNPNHRIRIHFIEGTTTKLTTTLVLSGIPPELSDLAVISSLNQFGQVVAPLESRNYKGIDISERIAKLHLVVTEGSLPEYINVSGYEVRIRAEKQLENIEQATGESGNNKLLLAYSQKHAPAAVTADAPPLPSIILKQPQRKYGFIDPTTVTTAATEPSVAVAHVTTAGTGTAGGGPISVLKPHKPVIRSSSSAPRLETPAPGTLTCPLPPVEQKRQSSVCVGNIPLDQHPSKLIGKQTNVQIQHQPPKVTIAQQQLQTQAAASVPNLQPPAKKPLARLLVSSPGSIPQSPVSSPGSPSENPVYKSGIPGEQKKEGALKTLYKNFDTKRNVDNSRSHTPLTPSSSYSPRNRRKSSVQFVGNTRKGKREPLPWCGCWGLGCG